MHVEECCLAAEKHHFGQKWFQATALQMFGLVQSPWVNNQGRNHQV